MATEMTESTNQSKTSQQKRGIVKTVVIILVTIALIIALFLHKMFSPHVLTPADLRANGAIIFEQPRIIDTFELLDHTGAVFNNASLQGNWTFIFFGFTFCPDICPNTLAKLADTYKQLPETVQKKIRVIMVSVDPARDTTEQIANYVPYFHPEFIGVTGEFRQMMALSQSVNAAFTKVPLGDTYTIDHTANVAVLDPNGNYAGFLRPPFEIEKLKTSIIAIAESR